MTYEEIKKNYPVGKILRERTVVYSQDGYYYSQQDLDMYEERYDKVEIIDENKCLVTDITQVRTFVEGWVFDGKSWMPAYNSWDGWKPYTEEELENFEKEASAT